MSKTTFFSLFRRRGFSETLEILYQFPGQEIVQAKFFQALLEQESYPNTYFRVKNDLLEHGLIAYKLNDANDKVIFLTDRGKKVWNLINEIEGILD